MAKGKGSFRGATSYNYLDRSPKPKVEEFEPEEDELVFHSSRRMGMTRSMTEVIKDLYEAKMAMESHGEKLDLFRDGWRVVEGVITKGTSFTSVSCRSRHKNIKLRRNKGRYKNHMDKLRTSNNYRGLEDFGAFG